MSEAGPTQEKTARHGEHHRSDSFGALEEYFGASFFIFAAFSFWHSDPDPLSGVGV